MNGKTSQSESYGTMIAMLKSEDVPQTTFNFNRYEEIYNYSNNRLLDDDERICSVR